MPRKQLASSTPAPRKTLPAAGEGKRGEAGHIAYLLRQRSTLVSEFQQLVIQLVDLLTE